jgi:hypothetical protein
MPGSKSGVRGSDGPSIGLAAGATGPGARGSRPGRGPGSPPGNGMTPEGAEGIDPEGTPGCTEGSSCRAPPWARVGMSRVRTDKSKRTTVKRALAKRALAKRTLAPESSRTATAFRKPPGTVPSIIASLPLVACGPRKGSAGLSRTRERSTQPVRSGEAFIFEQRPVRIRPSPMGPRFR